ncbi:ligand-binding sensor domain-containing protein, partial [Arachidicoccus sp.]|uniref:ligand-binding sensor domain-containing protein n=1 Tax=Arachidicoccus sp. TaxID=1872624 RepID=UPI003D19683F
MSVTKGLILFIILLTSNLVVRAQIKSTIDYYGTEDGLSHNVRTSVIKDKEGFMWMGSWNGINRFDGKKFVNYKPSARDKYQLETNRIDQLVDDRIGGLWLKAYDGHIYKFDKASKKFYPLYVLLNDTTLRHIRFYRLIHSRKGLIWILSENNGIFCINPKPEENKKYLHFSRKLKAPYSLVSNNVNIFFEDNNNNIWLGTNKGLNCLTAKSGYNYKSVIPDANLTKNILRSAEDKKHVYFGTADGMLIIFDKQHGRTSYIQLSGSSINCLERSKISNFLYVTTAGGELISINTSDNRIKKYSPGLGSLLRIYEDRSGVLWIEPEKSNVIKFDPLTSRFSIVKTDQPPYSQSNNASLFKVFEDLNGVVWINTKNSGFGFYDKASDKIKRIPYGDRSIPFPNFVEFAYYDSSGVFWVRSDRGGIIKVTLQPDNFNRELLMLPRDLRTENEVRAVYVDHKNRLWIACKSRDIYIVDHNKKMRPVFSNISPKQMGAIYSIYEDRKGRIWMGSKTNGIFIATPEKGELAYNVVHFGRSSGQDGLTSNQIYSIAQDKYGNIWLGSFDGGLMKIEETAHGIKDKIFFKNYPRTGFNKIRHLYFDHRGNLWIGTTGGLVIMEGGSDTVEPQFISYRKLSAEKESLGDNDIQNIYEDSEKRIWLATSGGGLGLAIGGSIKKLKFKNYTIKDGLANDFIYSMIEDKSGNLWVATENGLSKFNYSTGIFVNYNFYDGLPGTPFSEGSDA